MTQTTRACVFPIGARPQLELIHLPLGIASTTIKGELKDEISKLTSFGVLITLCVLGALIVPKARADEWDKKTTLTFNEPVQVPGATLSAGTYVFKLADSSDRTIVQIWNEDETKLITTILAIADYREKTPDKTIVSFDERPSGSRRRSKHGLSGDNFGVEFVYPKQRATELAQANQQPVLSVREDATDAASMKTATVEPVAPPRLRWQITLRSQWKLHKSQR